MADTNPHRAADLAWSEKVAHLVVEGLIRAKAVQAEQSNRAVEVITKEIYDVLAIGDRPAS